MEVDKTLDRSDDRLDAMRHRRRAGAFRYAWLFSSSREHASRSEYCEGRIPDVIHYSAKAWRSGKSHDFHRRASTSGAQPGRLSWSRPGRVAIFLSPLLFPPPHPAPCVFRDPKISSRSHGKIEKLTPLLAGIPRRPSSARIAPPAHTRFPLYDAPRRFRAVPPFRWIFLGRIHNVHLCTGQ